MSLSELTDKPANAGPFSGMYRTTILKNILTGDEQDYKLKLLDGTEIEIDIANNKVKALAALLPKNDRLVSDDEKKEIQKELKKKPLVTIDGDEYTISDILKSEIFGGGGKGSGSGSENTEKQESLQAIACSICATLKKEIDESDFTVENIKKARSSFDISYKKSNEEYAQELLENDWKQVYIDTANILRKHLNFDKSCEFHRDSDWVKDLKKDFSKLNKLEKSKFKDINKWNPADIWMLRGNHKLPPAKSFDNLIELNEWLATAFHDEKGIVGISLKKTGKSNIHYTIENAHKACNSISDVKYVKLIASKTSKLFSSKDAHIYFDDFRMQFKPKEIMKDIQGEISGKSARHGGVGYGGINSILKDLKLDTLDKASEIKSRIDSSNSKKEDIYKDILNDLIDMIIKVSPDESKEELRKAFLAAEKTDKPEFVVSKFQAIQLLSILAKASFEKQKDFVLRAFAYAASQSELSSIFVKVH